MNINMFIDDVVKQIKYKPIQKEISCELKNHMKEAKEDYKFTGLSDEEIEEKVVLEMGDSKKIGKLLNNIHKPKLDWKLLIILLVLMGFGITVAILKQMVVGDRYIDKIVVYFSIGVLLGTYIYFFDYRKLKKYSAIMYIIASIVMIFPIINYNDIYNFRLGLIKFEPCVLAIPLYIIAFVGCLDNYLKNKVEGSERVTKTELLKLLLLVFSSIIITALASAINSIILSTVYLTIFMVERFNIEQERNKMQLTMGLMLGSLFFLLVITLFIRNNLSFNNGILIKKENNNSTYIENIQYEIMQNLKPLGKSEIALELIKEQDIYHKDQYSFIILLANLGIIPSIILCLTMILLIARIICNIKNIEDNYGKFLLIGIGMLYMLESIMNIYMNCNSQIKADINLPFISYGATYFFVNIACLSIILSIYRRKNINNFNLKNKSIMKKLGQMLIKIDKNYT